MATLVQVVLLIAKTCCELLAALLLMRFFMQWFRAPFDGPVGHFVLALTNWLVLPLRRIVPPVRAFDTASLLAAYLSQVALLALVAGLTFPAVGAQPLVVFVLLHGLSALARLAIYLFIVLLVVQALLSWFNPYSPHRRLVDRLTDPLLRPLRRIIPPIANIDLTPLVAILAAQILLIFV
ncbi:MAG: YggT family protein [Candidatus Accumulibacter sp.]|nr:YggT family protein [Accumulibacter sp.]